MTDRLVPLKEVFFELSLSISAGYRLIREGRLGPVLKNGRKSLILQSDVERFKSSLRSKQIVANKS